jgi:hypothetical protein
MTGGMSTINNTWNRQPGDAVPKRCDICGAFGNATLCPKHFKSFMEAFDVHTDGAFSAFIAAYRGNPKFRKSLEVKKDGKA